MPIVETFDNIVIPNFLTEEIYAHNSYDQIRAYIDNKRPAFEKWFSEATNRSIKSYDSWVNFTPFKEGLLNRFEWHNELGEGHTPEKMRGTHTGLVWIAGEANCGGELGILLETGIEHVKFDANKIVIFPIELFHCVEHYTGSVPRISLTFTFELK